MKLTLKMRNLRWAGLVVACVLSTALVAVPAQSATFPTTWGENRYGQLCDGTKTDRHEPVAVDTSGALAGKTITAISTGTYHNLALTSDARLYAWGSNERGGLGDGTITNRKVPVAVNISGVLAGQTITAISAGDQFSLALSSEGHVYAWGYNLYGQLGNGTSGFETSSSVPVEVDRSGVLAGKTIVAIRGGLHFSLALSSEGHVYAWGYNAYGGLGDGTTTNRNVPVAVNTSGVLAGKTIVAISGGFNHSLALSSEGRIGRVSEMMLIAKGNSDRLFFKLCIPKKSPVRDVGRPTSKRMAQRLTKSKGIVVKPVRANSSRATPTALICPWCRS